MKNIVFVIESLQCGGAEKSLVTLLNLLDPSKFNINVLLFTKDGEFEKFVPPQLTIKQESLNENSSLLARTYHRFLFWFVKKAKIRKNWHPAQIHWSIFGKSIPYHTTSYDIAIAYNQGFATYYVANKMSSKVKYTWLNTDYKNAGYNISFDYQFYKRYNRIICVSKESEKSIGNELKKIGQKLPIVVIRDISDADFIYNMSMENTGLDHDEGYTNILTVGRLAKAKGYNLAIEACKILMDKGFQIKWFVIGDGPQRSEIEKLITENKLQDHFILLGFKENPYPYMESCDIYAQTSLFEGLGLTVIEAAILQKPIVTTNFPTASTIVEHDKTGLICEMSPEAIATSIERYINDLNLVEKIVKNLLIKKNEDKEESLKKINELLNV